MRITINNKTIDTPNRWQDCYPAAVIRFVPTFIGPNGLRTLMLTAQGRQTFETAREAERWIDAVRAHTSADTLRQVYNGEDTFEVCACPCWPGHFDPCGVYFDDCDIVGNEPEPTDEARPTVDFHE